MTNFWLNVVPQPDGSHRPEQIRRMTLTWYGGIVGYLITTVVMVSVFGINYQGSAAEVTAPGKTCAEMPEDGMKRDTTTETESTDEDGIDLEAATDETCSAVEEAIATEEDDVAEATGATQAIVIAKHSTEDVKAEAVQ